MSEENEKTNIDSYTSSNDNYTDANVIQIRLNTEPLLDKAMEYLSGTKLVESINDKGLPEFKQLQLARPKANQEGIYGIMNWLSSIVNSQMVQGNIESFIDKDNKVADFRDDFSEYIMKNLINWEIDEEDYEGIIDIMVTQMDLFLSRLVGNKERESYSNTIKHVENNSSQIRGSKGFKIPGF